MSQKKNISVRLSEADLRRIKDIASRLSIKDSDLFRFSVKLMLSRMMPLLRKDMRGVDILLIMLDASGELLRYFEFDAHQLDRVVNADVPADRRVAMEDIELVAIAMLNQDYLRSQLIEMGVLDSPSEHPVDVLRDHLYQKYCAAAAQDLTEVIDEPV